MTEQSFNISPYFDDFNEDKQFYRILFNPSRPVQARELTQIQSILSNQNKKLLEHFFEEGSIVIPGQLAYDSIYSFVKVESQYLGNDITLSDFQGKTIIGQTTGVKALVIKITDLDNTDPNTLFIKYLNSGTNGTSKTFSDGELLETDEDIPIFVNVLSANSTGFGSSVNIEEGWYFINGMLCKALKQALILDKYSNSPSYKIGLEIKQTIVNSGDDSSLLDNALGAPNLFAPGADRYKIELVLAKKTLDEPETENFIELLLSLIHI